MIKIIQQNKKKILHKLKTKFYKFILRIKISINTRIFYWKLLSYPLMSEDRLEQKEVKSIEKMNYPTSSLNLNKKTEELLPVVSKHLPKVLIIELHFKNEFFKNLKNNIRPTPPRVVSLFLKKENFFNGELSFLNFTTKFRFLMISQNKLFHSTQYHLYIEDISLSFELEYTEYRINDSSYKELENFIYSRLKSSAYFVKDFADSLELEQLKTLLEISIYSTNLTRQEWVIKEQEKKFLCYKTSYPLKKQSGFGKKLAANKTLLVPKEYLAQIQFLYTTTNCVQTNKDYFLIEYQGEPDLDEYNRAIKDPMLDEEIKVKLKYILEKYYIRESPDYVESKTNF